MENEIWRPVKGYEGLYEVSNLGRVRSLARTCKSRGGCRKPIKERVLCSEVTAGYVRVNLSMDGYMRHYLVHRLVAEAFIPNPENLPMINHINEDKTDNRVENLEWCTASYNINYGECVIKIKKNQPHKRPVCQYDKDWVLLAEYQSLHEAGKLSGVRWQDISACCCGRQNTAKGYIWRYKNKE